MNLSALTSIPGVHQAAVADDSGRLLDLVGEIDPPSSAVLVLGHATLAAAAELGRRSGAGDCIEIVQRHEGGCVYLHSLPHRRVLMVRCGDGSAISAVRAVVESISHYDEPEPSRCGAFDVSYAMHAEPAW